MATISFQADLTTLILNGNAITSFAAGDILTLEFPNEKTARTNAANGGVTIAGRTDGDVADLVVRIQRNSPDDVLLNSLKNSETPIVMEGSIKQPYQRDGADFVDSYSLEGGSFTAQAGASYNNTDGEDGNVIEYTIQFRKAVRTN